MRLLIGFDGSDGGRDALELARVFGSREASIALVVSVLPYDRLPFTFAELEQDAAADAQPWFEEARRHLQGLDVQTRAFAGGSAAGILTDLAERDEFDLVVVGSPHRGAVGRALLGSVARGLLHGAPNDVVVAPRGYSEEPGHGPFGLVAVAYDGTPEAQAALHRARALAKRHGAAVRVLTVVTPPTPLPGVVGYTPPDPVEPGSVLEEGVRGLGDEVEAEGRLLEGPPAETLAEACEEGVDLLVAGSRGYGPLTRVLVGSVTSSLIDISPCPVLVVPRPQTGD